MSEETVVGWDGTAPAHQALEWALARAESRGENVLIARVVEESTMGPPGRRREAAIEAAEYSLDQARLLAQAKHPRLAVTGRLLLGDSVDELRSLTDEDTLLAVGTSASDDVASVDAWWVGARLAATSFGPVALVPDGSGARDDSRSGIVAGIDGSGASLVAAGFAAAEAVRGGEELIALHAWQVPPAWEEAHLEEETLHALEEIHRGILDTATERIRHEFPTVRMTKVLVQRPAMAALREASRTCRLLVVGNHGLKSAPRLTLGPVSHSLVRAIDVPTVVVRERPESHHTSGGNRS